MASRMICDLNMRDLRIGCEYIPAGKTEDGLQWIKPYL